MNFPGKDWATATPASQGLDAAKLAAAMAAFARISGAEGTRQAMVVRNGKLVWAGPEIDRPLPIWSSTKSFLSLTMGLLVADGRCSLDTRAADLYPALAADYPTITLRHLITFTSGYAPQAASADVAPFTPGKPLFAPGEKFHYSWESFLLALLLTKAAGEPLRDLFARRVAKPVGLDPAAWSWGDWGPFDHLTSLAGVPVCGGSGLFGKGVTISARALARVGWLCACGGRWRNRQIVDPRWLAESTRAQVPASLPDHKAQQFYSRLPGTYGYYWWTNGVAAAGRRLWPHAPHDTFAMVGHLNNVCLVVPSWRMVVVRLGADTAIDTDLYDTVFSALKEALREQT